MTSEAENLQTMLDSASPGATLTVPPGEYKGLFFFRVPVTLDGSGATLMGDGGPVVNIESSQVTIRDLVIEASGPQLCAISVKPGCDPQFRNVEVVGEIVGLDGEEGSWSYPSKFPLGNLVAGTPNRFTLTVSVPVACEIVSDDKLLTASPRHLLPGFNQIAVSIPDAQTNTGIGTPLWLQTAHVSRQIWVFGRVVGPKAFIPWDLNAPAKAPEIWETVLPPPSPRAEWAAHSAAPHSTLTSPTTAPSPPAPRSPYRVPSPLTPPEIPIPVTAPWETAVVRNQWTVPAVVCAGFAFVAGTASLLGGWVSWLPTYLVIAAAAAALLAGGAAWKTSFVASGSGMGPGLAAILFGLAAGGAVLYPSGQFHCSQLIPVPGFSGAGQEVASLSLSPKGDVIVAGYADASVRAWDTGTGASKWTVNRHDGAVRAAAFSPDGHTVATGGEDLKVLIADASSGETLRVLRGYDAAMRSVSYSPEGRFLAAGLDNGSIQIWDLSDNSGDNHPRSLDNNGGPVRAVAWSPDGSSLLSGEADQRLVLWDVQAGAVRKVYRGFSGNVNAVALTTGGRTAAAAIADGIVRLWDSLPENQNPTIAIEGGSPTLALTFSRSGKTLVGFGRDLRLNVWSTDNGELRRGITARGAGASSAALALNAGVVSSANQAGNLNLWRCN